MTQRDPLVPPQAYEQRPADTGAEQASLLPGKLRLDELLADLLDRVQELQGQRHRLRVLLDEVVGISSGLGLEETLRRIVEAARDLVEARYAAVGVLAEEGGLSEFIAAGFDDETIAAVGHFPEGHGILGLLIDQPKPLRLDDLSLHPAASGFPPGHPPMRSFLGVPITVRGRVFGNLYLTEKTTQPAFNEDDEQYVLALAGAAGIAIENARLYEQAELRQRWLTAGATVSHELLATADDPSLSVITQAMVDVADDDLVALWMLTDGHGPHTAEGSLLCRAAAGPGSEALIGLVAGPGTLIAHQVMTTGQPCLIPNLDDNEVAWKPPSGLPVLRSAMFLPLIAESGPLGVLVLARGPQRPVHGSDEVDMAQGFATQVALALSLAARQQDRRQLAVFADRDRIARDLHDQVIQQLFASGLSLQGLAMTLPGEAAAKVDQVVQSLDDTIGDLRRAIFSLRAPDVGDRGLRARLVEVVSQSSAAGLGEPRLRFDGALDSGVPQSVADDAVAVVREAVTNAARHAGATAVDVRVSLLNANLTVTVTDNGVGLPPVLDRQSGLRNLRTRAESHHGSLSLEVGPNGRGTTVRWEVPIS